MTNINSTTEAPAEIQQALVTLRAVAEWLESSVSYGQSSPEEPPAPQSEFDHRLGQAAAEIANVANSIESAQSRQPSAQGGEPEPVALAFPHSQDFSETKCPDCGKKFYVEREFFPPPAGGGKEALSDAERPNNAVLVPADGVRGMANEYQAWLDFYHAGNGSFDDFLCRNNQGEPS